MTNRAMSEIIRNRTPVTLPPTATVQEACRYMHKRRIGAVLVTDAKGKLSASSPAAMPCGSWRPGRTRSRHRCAR